MPIIREIFNETITLPTTSSIIKIPIVNSNQNFPQTSIDTTLSVASVTEVSTNFFKNLKHCLQQTTLDIDFNDEEFSFTVFGMKFYCICYTPYTTTAIDHFSVIPSIYRNGGKLSSHPVNSNGNNYFAIGKSATIMEYNNNELLYQINIHYNTNFLYITYGSKINLNSTYPLCCIIKCKTVDDSECLYTSLNPNAYSTTNTINTIVNYHIITMIDKPYINYPNTTNYYINKTVGGSESDMFTRVNHQNTGIRHFFDENKIIKIQPICMQGAIIFGDNCIGGPHDITPGYYSIDGETYFCPGDSLYESAINASPSDINYCQKILLKI